MRQLLLTSTFADPTIYVTFGLLVALALMIWFSSRRRKVTQDQVMKMHDELRPGQRIRTVGGVVGRIKEIREESPGFRTVLLETGNAKYPAYMLFDIQAVYGIVPEEGHTLSGSPIIDPAASANARVTKAQDASSAVTASSEDDINAREYVDKRNNFSTTKKKQTKRK